MKCYLETYTINLYRLSCSSSRALAFAMLKS